MTTAPANKLLQLTYGRQPPRWRRWVRRLFLLAWLATTLWLVYCKWGVLVRVHFAVVYAERVCLSHTEPADRVVIDLDRGRAAGLVRNPEYAYGKIDPTGWYSGPPAPTSAAVFYRGMESIWDEYQAAYNLRSDYDRLWNASADSRVLTSSAPKENLRFDDSNIIFIHSRRAPGREARLLCLRCFWSSFFDGVGLSALLCTTSNTGNGVGFAAEIMVAAKGIETPAQFRSADRSASLRLYAPQPDLNDESRFTIRYDTNVGGGTLEGALGADDKISIRVVDGPIGIGFK